MNKFNLILILLLTLFSVQANAQKSKIKPAKKFVSNTDKLIQTDKAFCSMSLKSGLNAAFVHYGDKDLIKLGEGSSPIFGLEALKQKFKNEKGTSNLIWTPVKAEVAKSNDLGYTFGNWQIAIKTIAGKDSTLYGNYVTIWKKQKDGTWKYVLDTGVNGPAPKEK